MLGPLDKAQIPGKGSPREESPLLRSVRLGCRLVRFAKSRVRAALPQPPVHPGPAHEHRVQRILPLSVVAHRSPLELQVDAKRRCRHCQAGGAVRRGKTRGLRRYSCKRCGKTFNALSGTALSGLHHKQRWLALGRSLVERESVRESARRSGVAVTTAFRWRHRFMAQAGQLQGRLEGLVEADETYVLHSRKGQRQLARKARRRGGRARQRGLSKQQVPVLLATACGGATVGQVLASVSQASLQAALEPLLASDAVLLSDGGRANPDSARRLGIQYEAVDVSAGLRVRDSYHV